MTSTDALLIYVTCPPEHAPALAQLLVDARLAACINILPGVASVYRWQGQVQRDDESLLLIKTSRARYAALEQIVREHHPYELPEVLAVAVEAGSPAYLDWIRDATR